MTEEEQKHHWNLISHVERKISPLSDKIHGLETHKEIQERRIIVLESAFTTHMNKEEIHWAKQEEQNHDQGKAILDMADMVRTEISSIKKVLFRIVWVGTGVAGTIAVFWAFIKPFIS